MDQIPVNTKAFRFYCAGEGRPVTDRDGNQRHNTDGKPMFQLPVICIATDASSSAGTFVVKVAGAVPTVEQMAEVELQGLTARHWEISGRSGLSFTCDSINVRKAA